MNAEMIDLQIFAGGGAAGGAGAGASGAGPVSAGAGARSAGTGGGSGAGAGGGGTGGPSGSGKGQSGQSGSAGQALKVAEAGAEREVAGDTGAGQEPGKRPFIPEKAKKMWQKTRDRYSGRGVSFSGVSGRSSGAGQDLSDGQDPLSGRGPAGEQQTRAEAVGGADEKSGQGNVPVTDAEQRRQADRDKGEEKPTYQQLIAGEYAEAHKAYMDRTIAERFRKFSADRARLEKATDLLSTIAEVYGVDPRAEDFYEQLRNKVAVDDSRAAQYAAENDCSVETARKMLQMQLESAQSRQAARRAEQARQEYEAQARAQEESRLLQQAAAKTKAKFPGFDLETELRSDRFRRLVWACNGDTTAAYMACHPQDILTASVRAAEDNGVRKVMQTVASNTQRPVENGMGAPAAVQSVPEFRDRGLAGVREFAARMRKMKGGQ